MDVTVAVATFGDPSWQVLAATRAVPSARALGVPVVQVHADTLHGARNTALDRVTTEWVIHLDADDELEPGYIDAMAAATADLRAPAVRYIHGPGGSRPRMPQVAGHHHPCTAGCLLLGNWLVVGTAARTALLHQVGGWRNFEWSEDWDLWLRCYQAGATVEPVPAAVYRAHVRADSRNRGQSDAAKMAAHKAIADACGVPMP